jgi:CRP/FNR family cyclic AMP-dependent transcriptional regulator
MTNENILKKLYLFKDLSEDEIKIIEQAVTNESYGPGEEVFSQGARANDLFLIQSGTVKIHQLADSDDSVEITRIGAGAHFGEMSFLDGEVRSASATSLEQTDLIKINYDKLSEIMIEHPGMAAHFYRQFAIFLCGRMRVTTKDLSFSRSKILSHF